jgi:hypothetical protein
LKSLPGDKLENVSKAQRRGGLVDEAAAAEVVSTLRVSVWHMQAKGCISITDIRRSFFLKFIGGLKREQVEHGAIHEESLFVGLLFQKYVVTELVDDGFYAEEGINAERNVTDEGRMQNMLHSPVSVPA